MSVEEELFDAAKIDGANWWQLQWNVTVPQLSAVIEFFSIVSVITMLSWVFGYVYVMTGGGPGSSTMVTELFIYVTAFRYNQMNKGSDHITLPYQTSESMLGGLVDRAFSS